MPRTRDLGRSREIIARRKQARAAAIWAPEMQADRSWMKHARCILCERRFVVNNYPDHKIRDTRTFKRWVCPWCLARGGKDNVRRMMLVERMIDTVPCTQVQLFGKEPENCKCVVHVARRLYGHTLNGGGG